MTDILLLGQNEKKNEHMISNTLCYMGCYTGYKNTDKNFALHFVAFHYTIPLKEPHGKLTITCTYFLCMRQML